MALFSVLDLSPVTGENTQAEAVRESIEVARAAERLGYHRFWVAEHHNIGGLGSPAPEILIAALTQATQAIRLGSGGVMLVNYSPLKVAEAFMELEALAPGRIDLGVGRALGADPRTGGALLSAGSAAFEHYFELLAAWLLDASGKAPLPAEHPAHGIRANPSGPSHPELHMLCSSAESAAWAGAAGVGMVFAEFIARADGGPAVGAYRAAFKPSPFLDAPWAGIATVALAADTAEAARRLDAPRRASQLSTLMGERRRFRSIHEAEAFLGEHAASPALAAIEARSITGDGAAVRARLEQKAAAAGADELFVMATGFDLASRIRSLELIKGC